MNFTTVLLVAIWGTAHGFAFIQGHGESRSPSVSSTLLNMASEESRRVVVTGLGVVSGCGIGHEDFFNACLEGKSSIARVKRFDISHMPCQIGSEVPDEMFDPKDWFTNPKNIKSNDRYTHLAVAAARQALQDAGLGDTPETLEDPDRIGVMVGTAFGGMETFEQQTLKLAQNPEKPKVCTPGPYETVLSSGRCSRSVSWNVDKTRI
jgi:3-oxoacyl-(acyl-carrier-protein) synthase